MGKLCRSHPRRNHRAERAPAVLRCICRRISKYRSGMPPAGVERRFESLRQAFDAAAAGNSTAEYAGSHPEFEIALASFGG